MVAPGHWRISFDAAMATLDTRHIAECPDVAPECAVLFIPPHEHRVRLQLTHYELEAAFGLRRNMQLSLRVPYDVKDMRVRYTTLTGEPFTPPYGDIHHRTERLTGISDPSMMLDITPHADWMFGIGTTFPIGHVEPDPVELGRRGIAHQHIQFGSGTFEPKLSAQWTHRAFSARAEARLSLYENREGFRAPTILAWSLGPTIRAGRIAIDPRLTGQYQSIGRWHGEIDEGSGFHNGGIRVQLSMPWRSIVIAPGVHRELWNRSLQNEETFHQPWTYSLMISRLY